MVGLALPFVAEKKLMMTIPTVRTFLQPTCPSSTHKFRQVWVIPIGVGHTYCGTTHVAFKKKLISPHQWLKETKITL